MKTSSKRILALAGLLLAGMTGATVLAGPGPQAWARPVATQPAGSSTIGCTRSRTDLTFARFERGPAGAGAQGVSVARREHHCDGCGDAPKAVCTTAATSASCGAMNGCR